MKDGLGLADKMVDVLVHTKDHRSLAHAQMRLDVVIVELQSERRRVLNLGEGLHVVQEDADTARIDLECWRIVRQSDLALLDQVGRADRGELEEWLRDVIHVLIPDDDGNLLALQSLSNALSLLAQVDVLGVQLSLAGHERSRKNLSSERHVVGGYV